MPSGPPPARIDPEDPLAIPAAPIVEWYRVDVTRRVVRRLAAGSACMIVGMLAVSRLVMGAGVGSLGWGLVGIVTVIVGGCYAVIGLQRILGEEQYVALRVDGVLVVDGDDHRYRKWEDIDDVRHDREGDAVVLVSGDEEWSLGESFAGIANVDLARSAAAVRRKALFGLFER
jgi:hypothetical protein